MCYQYCLVVLHYRDPSYSHSLLKLNVDESHDKKEQSQPQSDESVVVEVRIPMYAFRYA